jgi:hypothetical protein
MRQVRELGVPVLLGEPEVRFGVRGELPVDPSWNIAPPIPADSGPGEMRQRRALSCHPGVGRATEPGTVQRLPGDCHMHVDEAGEAELRVVVRRQVPREVKEQVLRPKALRLEVTDRSRSGLVAELVDRASPAGLHDVPVQFAGEGPPLTLEMVLTVASLVVLSDTHAASLAPRNQGNAFAGFAETATEDHLCCQVRRQQQVLAATWLLPSAI